MTRFFKIYTDTVAAHAAKGAPKYSFTPPLAGWATVCYGLVRHPEFHALLRKEDSVTELNRPKIPQGPRDRCGRRVCQRAALPSVRRSHREAKDEFFIFIHASGGWDVTLWSDPRNERKGLVDPASTTQLHRHRRQTLGRTRRSSGSESTFQLVQPSGSNIVFGPAIGDLGDLFDRCWSSTASR